MRENIRTGITKVEKEITEAKVETLKASSKEIERQADEGEAHLRRLEPRK